MVDAANELRDADDAIAVAIARTPHSRDGRRDRIAAPEDARLEPIVIETMPYDDEVPVGIGAQRRGTLIAVANMQDALATVRRAAGKIVLGDDVARTEERLIQIGPLPDDEEVAAREDGRGR